MGVLSTLASWFVPEPDHQRSAWEFPPLSEQLIAINRRNAGTRPWRIAGVEEALGVPAILGAVSLIADTVGSMSLEAYRNGLLLTDPPQIPSLIQRPNPLTVPRLFFRDTAFYLATRGEAWWWVAKRDPFDNSPLSLFPVPPWEIMVEQNQRDRLKPTITWNDTEISREDMRQITYMPGRDGRGQGPLQLAGAAASVSVEADAFAANFYSGSIPSFVGTTTMDLDEEELAALDAQWAEKPNNLPRWLTNDMKLSEPPYNMEKAQITQTRQHQVGETARMFNMPGSLIEYNMPGASLRYQNDEQIWTDFQRRCLTPHYLEPIEQEMSDLLPRSTAARFNLKQLLRGSAKERAEYYEKMIPLGVIMAEEARKEEGYAPGHIDYASVAQSPPRAVVDKLPFERSVQEVRCPNGHLTGKSVGYAENKCHRCGQMAYGREQERSMDAGMIFAESVRQIATREQPAPTVTVHPAQITFERGAFEAPDMSGLGEAIAGLANQKPPQVNIEVPPPDMTGVADAMAAMADRPQTPTEVNVSTPPDETLTQAIEELRERIDKPRVRRIERDADGRIIRLVEEVA